MLTVPGGEPSQPCPNPDTQPLIADIATLYHED